MKKLTFLIMSFFISFEIGYAQEKLDYAKFQDSLSIIAINIKKINTNGGRVIADLSKKQLAFITLKNLNSTTIGLLAGTETGAVLAGFETKFNLKTSPWNNENLRKTYDWIASASDLLMGSSVAAIGLNKDQNKDFAAYVGIVGVALKILNELFINPKAGKSEIRDEKISGNMDEIAVIGTQLAISRVAYEDTKIRLQFYTDLRARLIKLKKDLVELDKNWPKPDANISESDVNNALEVIKLGQKISQIGIEVDNHLGVMLSQSYYYKQQGNAVDDVRKLFDDLYTDVDKEKTNFEKDVQPLFNQINNFYSDLLIAISSSKEGI